MSPRSVKCLSVFAALAFSAACDGGPSAPSLDPSASALTAATGSVGATDGPAEAEGARTRTRTGRPGDHDRLEAFAHARVERADGLYQRAVEAAGPDPEAEVARALGEARELLGAAHDALVEEDWREAIRLANGSIELSERVISYLEGERGDRLKARAESAVQHAQELLVRVGELLDEDDRPALLAAFGEARVAVGQAEAALQVGDYSRAIIKAQQAIQILREIVAWLS